MFFDTHAHTQFAAFAEDGDAVIERALAAGVWMINVGTQRDTSRRAVEVAREYSQGVYASVGLHPVHTERLQHGEEEMGTHRDAPAKLASTEHLFSAKPFQGRGEVFDYDYYRELALDPKVLTIGECGLDYFRLSEETKQRQTAAFEQQIRLAHEVGKPLMLHCRSAFDDLIQILTANRHLLRSESPGIAHFFTGTVDHAKTLLDLGFSFSFGGAITAAGDYDEAIRAIPIDRLLSETDAPFVAPVRYRGKRNEPAFVVEVVRRLAEIRQSAFQEMETALWQNARAFFRQWIALPER